MKRALLLLIAGAAMCSSAASATDAIASSTAVSSDATQKAANLELVPAQNAFEFFTIAIQAVPEPTTWMMLILGMLGVGFAMRRPASESTVRVRYP